MPKSMLELAYEFIVSKKKAVTFKDIWQYIQKQTDEKESLQLGRFYKLITLDGRFVALGSNKWDLKERYTFKELYDDARGVFREVEAPEEASEETDEDPFNEAGESEDEDEDKPKKRKTDDED
jgi:DNA-directed RNA polymerase subunit delta